MSEMHDPEQSSVVRGLASADLSLSSNIKMFLVRASVIVSIALACLASSVAAFLVSGAGSVLRTSAGCISQQQQQQSATQAQAADLHRVARHAGVRALRAAADDGDEGGGGFVNPYTAFRKWQMDLVRNSSGSKQIPFQA